MASPSPCSRLNRGCAGSAIASPSCARNRAPTALRRIRPMLVDGAPIPRYPGLQPVRLEVGRRLLSRLDCAETRCGPISPRKARWAGRPCAPHGGSAFRPRPVSIRASTTTSAATAPASSRPGSSPGCVVSTPRDATLVPTYELQQQLRAQGFQRVQRLGRAVDTRQFHPGWRDAGRGAQWAWPRTTWPCSASGAWRRKKPATGPCAPSAPCRPSVRARAWSSSAMARIARNCGPRCRMRSSAACSAATNCRGITPAPTCSCSPACPKRSATSRSRRCSGLATVAFDYGATREHLRDGEHGAAVASGDEAAFVVARRCTSVRRLRCSASARRRATPCSTCIRSRWRATSPPCSPASRSRKAA